MQLARTVSATAAYLDSLDLESGLSIEDAAVAVTAAANALGNQHCPPPVSTKRRVLPVMCLGQGR